ncbi:hypothetical protein V1525DRAFT_410989 [Lipomyces kononenkoae]|uniref:Uncharacterized protein n=1 Tax=Lipomyces kononenkoae TaxID=34357 RepID=A0ACC3STZ5_LIPKO
MQVQSQNAAPYMLLYSNKKVFFAEFKGSYEEALGNSRSAADNTMRKAPRTYFHMRPQNQCR